MEKTKENILKIKKDNATLSLLSRYKFLFENIPNRIVIFEISSEGFPTKIIDANQAFREDFDYEKKELPMISIFDIFNIDKLDSIKEMIRNLIKDKKHKGICQFYSEKKKIEYEYYVVAVLKKYMEHNIVIMTLNERQV